MGKYRKSRAFSPDGFFECEGRGLQWLGAAHAQGGPRVVEVYEWGRDFLDIERVNSCSPTPKAAYDFGAALARMHDSGAEFFGSAPAGYMGTCYFGPLQDPVPMDCGTWTDPATYLAEGRLRPMVELGIRRRELTDADMGLTEEVIQALPEILGRAAADKPARVHGDLWSGNVMWTADSGSVEAVLIDPAAHGGHREEATSRYTRSRRVGRNAPHYGSCIRSPGIASFSAADMSANIAPCAVPCCGSRAMTN